ncbi:MAG: radical SAM protein [Myxococcales bacterium]|nr:radical SAM protein [Myxococcales bacterium]
MRILLVVPNIATRNGLHYPHGLGALAAGLAAAGHEPVVSLPQEMLTRESWRLELRAAAPDWLACGFSSHQWPFARQLMAWAREAGVPVLAGGVHATFAPEEILAAAVCDGVCVGEGEGALLDLAGGKPLTAIANVQTGTDRPALRPLLTDLDALPIYDRRHFPMAEILRVNGGELTALAGRGCPYPCTYCCNEGWRRLYSGEPWVRWRSVSHLLAELDCLCGRYAVDSLYFEDDIFTLNREFLEEFLREFPSRFALPFRVYARIGAISRDDLRRLRAAGLWMVNVGVEHGDPRIRAEVLGRQMSNAQITEFFDWCRELGIVTRAFHILGVPGETPETAQATRDLCAATLPDQIQVSLFEPYPGTKLAERCRVEKLHRGVARPTYFSAEPALELPGFPSDRQRETYRAFCAAIPELEERALRRALAAARRGEVDLVERWAPELVRRTGAEPVVPQRARIGRETKFALFAHPRSEIAYELPPGRYRFFAALALDPRCYEWDGHGVRFLVRAGDETCLDRALNPWRRVEDRGWHEVAADFRLAEKGSLRLLTAPESGDDLTALWALWGHPHLTRSDG